MTESDNLDRIGKAMMLAWGRIKESQARMWGDWMAIGEGLLEGRRWAMQKAGTNNPEGKGYVLAYGEWLKRYKVDDMDKSDRAKLLQLMEDRAGVEEWRSTLTDYERRNLNNPTMVWRKWTTATRVKKPKPRSANVSGTEYARARAMIERLQARTAELEEELKAACERIKELEAQLNPTEPEANTEDEARRARAWAYQISECLEMGRDPAMLREDTDANEITDEVIAQAQSVFDTWTEVVNKLKQRKQEAKPAPAPEAETEDEPMLPAWLANKTNKEKAHWARNCPAVKNYKRHDTWLRHRDTNDPDNFGKSRVNSLGERIPNEERRAWNNLITMRRKAEQAKGTPEAETCWKFYKESLERAKAKYGYIDPFVIMEFPELGLETFD